MRIAVPVIVSVAVRTAPVFWATANFTVPFPAPDAPSETVRNAALLVAVHVHDGSVVTEIDAVPPDAGNDVVVTPVMIWHPDGAVVELLPHATARSKKVIDRIARAYRENL
jgi:hypothetical protein